MYRTLFLVTYYITGPFGFIVKKTGEFWADDENDVNHIVQSLSGYECTAKTEEIGQWVYV